MTAPARAKVRGWLSYTWNKAELDAYGRTYSFEYDRRHAVSGVVSYRASPNWELASTVRWSSGFPRTTAIGVRVVGVERTVAGVTKLEPKRDASGLLVYEADFGGVSNVNNARLPNYSRTDVRITWKPRGATGRWEFYAEAINVFKRENFGSVNTILTYNPGSDRPRTFEHQGDGSLPLIPTVGVRWRF